jgi:hypothetical protein
MLAEYTNEEQTEFGGPSGSNSKSRMSQTKGCSDGRLDRTFLFQINAALCHHNWHVAVNIAVALGVCEGYGDICISHAGLERDSKNALWLGIFCCAQSVSPASNSWTALPRTSSLFWAGFLLKFFHHCARSRRAGLSPPDQWDSVGAMLPTDGFERWTRVMAVSHFVPGASADDSCKSL